MESDGGYILYGRSLDSWSEPDSWMVKLNSQFEYEWHETFIPDDHGARFQDLTVNKNGDFVFSLGFGEIVKTDENGIIGWSEKYLNPEVRDIKRISVVENDGVETGYIAVGTVIINSWDIWISRLDLFGNTLWTKNLDSSSIFNVVDEEGVSIKQTSDGGFILAGDKYDGIWIIKLKAEEETSSYKPKITGPSNGEAGESYNYTFRSTHPEGDDIYFYIDWGDGTIEEWVGPYDSGEEVPLSHTWNVNGSYTIGAKARDTNGVESGWGSIEVSMPKTKFHVNPLVKILQYLNLDDFLSKIKLFLDEII
jgi:hypothetical protein